MNEKEIRNILARCDHTLLSVTATRAETDALIDEAAAYGTASVCIPPCYVKHAAEYSAGRVAVCTVVGFPNGYCTQGVKVAEARAAVADGADEIDMVINVCALKSGDTGYVKEEIAAVKKACGDKILKVIVEAALLTEEEKLLVCDLVTEAGADYIKTSTGFAKGGATVEDVALFRKRVGENVRVKAAGGIRTLEAAQAMIEAGADRIGASALVRAAKEAGL